MHKFILFSLVAFTLNQQISGQFSFQNAWRQGVQKLESITLPSIKIGDFELIPSKPEQENTEDENQSPTFDYDDIVENHAITTPATQSFVDEPIIEQVGQSQAFESSQIQQQSSADLTKKDDQTLIDFVVQKLTSIEAKIDKLQEELHEAKGTIQQQNKQLEQCVAPITAIPQEEDLSIYARVATTPVPAQNLVRTTPSQQSASHHHHQFSGQSRQRIESQYRATPPPYPQLHLSQQSTRVVSTAAPVNLEEQESQWFRDHSIVQVHGNGDRYSQNLENIGQQAFTDSSEELQGRYVKGIF